MKKAALYDPYLKVLGGGERYALSLLKTLEENSYNLTIFWDEDLTSQIKQKLNIVFDNKLSFETNLFLDKKNFLEKLNKLRRFDLFIYVTDGSYFFSPAKKNIVYIMVPQKKLCPLSLLNKLKTLNSVFITHSKFSQLNLDKFGVKSKLLYPYIDNNLINNSLFNKDKIILSVGRFFNHLHAKRQDIIINSFTKLQQSSNLFKDYKLILAGGLMEEDKTYYDSLQNIARDNHSIELKANIDFNELKLLYQKASFYWHFTGFGLDDIKNPELVEHLGITPLEAMASGCLTYCYNAGGPKELINDGVNGFLFNNEKELIQKMIHAVGDNNLQDKIRYNASKFIRNNFSYEIFKKNLNKLL